MSLSPWDLSGNITFDFSIYRPRRDSYVFATTQISRARNESYRTATAADDAEPEQSSAAFGGDFIDELRGKRRKDSYKQATNQEQLLDDDTSGVFYTATNNTSSVLEPMVPNHVSCFTEPRVETIVEQSEPSWSQDQLDLYSKPSLSRTPTVDSTRSFDCTRSLDISLRSLTVAPSRGGGGGQERMSRTHSCDCYDSAAAAAAAAYMQPDMPHDDDDDDPSEIAESLSECAFQSEPDPQTVIKNLHNKWRYRRNLFTLTLSFILVFTAFRSIQNLQSSINAAGKLGVICMGCVHGTMCLSCFFVPLFINKLSAKWTIVLGLLFYLLWIAANFYPHFLTLVPTSIGVGVGQSLAWGAQVTFMQKLAIDYSHLSRELTQQELYKFNGIFLACFQSTHIWGNLLSSLLLDSATLNKQQMKGKRVELDSLGESAVAKSTLCGVYDRCVDVSNVTQSGVKAAPNMIMKLMASHLLFAGIGFLLILLVLEKISAKCESEKSCLENAQRNIRQIFHHKTFRLLVPMLVFNGFEQGFVYADFNKSFITCTIGIENVGYTMITMGVTNSVFSMLVGLAARHVPREALVGTGAVLQMGIMVFLLVWMPDRRLVGVFYVIAALWGLCDAIWQTQCNCLVNLSCAEEHDVAFQNFRMLQGFGAASAFFLSAAVYVAVKLYIIIALLVVSVLFYVCAEYRIRNGPQETNSDTCATYQAPVERPHENHVTSR